MDLSQTNLIDTKKAIDRIENNKEKTLFSKYINGRSLFKNKKALSHNFIPNKIVHREDKIEELTSLLAPAVRGEQPGNAFIYGTTGTGKSICVKFVLDELIRAGSGKNIKTIYMNCKMKKVADTEYRLLAQLLREFNEVVPDTGLPTDVLYRRFFECIDDKKQTVIIALDEIDALIKKVGDEFLYNFTRIGNELKQASISILGITNDLSFSETLDARVKSSLGEEEILFKPYNAVQLKDILHERVGVCFNDGIISEGAINKCAALAAQEHGDARRAIDLLRVAAEMAERNGEDNVKEVHVDAAERKIDQDRIVETIKTQPRQSQLVLYTMLKLLEKSKNNEEEKASVSAGEVFDHYMELCKGYGYKPLTQRRVSDLINELDMLSIILAKVVSNGRYGRGRKIFLTITKSNLEDVKKMLDGVFS